MSASDVGFVRIATTVIFIFLFGCGGGGGNNAPQSMPADDGSNSVDLTVNARVVDGFDIGLSDITVILTRNSTFQATTNDEGMFELTLPESGEYDLALMQVDTTLLQQSVTVLMSGVIEEFGAVIEVQLPEDTTPVKTPDTSATALPPISIVPEVPSSEEVVAVNVTAENATSIIVDISGEGCGSLESSTVQGGVYSQRGNVSTVGTCTITAVVETSDDESTLVSSFIVTPTSIALPSVKVAGGLYIPSGELPVPSTQIDAPVITDVISPGDLINGGTGTFQIQTDESNNQLDIRQAYIKIVGIGGYFSTPVIIEDGRLTFDISIDQNFFDPGDSQGLFRSRIGAPRLGNLLEFIIQLIDRNGQTSNQFQQSADVVKVGAGTLQVSLSWDTPSDVDLHLVEPSGEEIYYKNKTSSSGGMLDLDSNADCLLDLTNNENVTWGDTITPPNGEYIIRVDYWSACGNHSANYTVTVNNCGKRETYSGSFAPEDADRGELGSGREIVRLDFNSCIDFRAAGRAVYEDFAQTSSGLSANSTMLPIRHARFEIRRELDDKLLASGSTDADGQFDATFGNDGDPNYYVVVMTDQDNENVRQQVIDDSGNIYGKKSANIDGLQNREKLDILIEAKKSSGAPAFNIFDIGLDAASSVRTWLGVTPTKLTWLWTDGKKGACRSEVSCYRNSLKQISVLSIAEDRDEYDDLVLLHEYGHFFQNNYSKSDSIGGSHSSSSQSDPRLAWGEGSATFFGNSVKGTSMYIDTVAGGVGTRYDIDILPSDKPTGTSNNMLDGRVSEAVIAAITWDLFDSRNEITGRNKPRDTISNPSAVFDALSHLGDASVVDRGHTGIDLVEFLDGWFCLGNNGRGDANTGVEGIVVGIYNFPYDFPTLESCR